MSTWRAVGLGIAVAWAGALCADASDFKQDTGYRGIWYFNQETGDEYVYKYSGGLGTYCANHIPMAVYAPAVEKTFFVYGGTKSGQQALLEMIGYYDHRTGRVPRPTILMDKKTSDAHDNPVLSIDDQGYLWVFASSHGTTRPSFIFRSRAPYDISDFERVLETNFSYPQPWFLPGKGFLFLHTYYQSGRGLRWMTSPDGRNWTERHLLAHIQEGHYQVSWPHGDKVGAAFNYHPTAFQGNAQQKGLNWRTNLYYIETDDMGEHWQTASGIPIETPIAAVDNPALVHNYEDEGLLCYTADLKFDTGGNPIILYVTSRSWKPGPDFGPRTWTTAHWKGDHWEMRPVTTSGNNYDTGALHVETDGAWSIIGPTETGPQPFNPGGEIALWRSTDEGVTWKKERQLTSGSEFNHTYVRPPLGAHPGFCAFWADGHGRQASESRLYFYDAVRHTVLRLPYTMTEPFATPEILPPISPP